MDTNQDILVDMDSIPVDDIAKAYEKVFEADGTPRPSVDVPAQAKAAPEPRDIPEKKKPDTRDADFDTLRRERDDARAARAQIERDALTALDAARIRAEKAEAEAERRTTQTATQYARATQAEFDSIESLLVSNVGSMSAVRDNLKQAIETGNADRQTELQAKLGELAAEKLQLDQAKRHTADKVREAQQFLREPPKKAVEPERKVEQPQPEKKQITPDEWIAQWPEATQEFLRDNMDYVTDPKKHQELLSFARNWERRYGAATVHSPPFIEKLNEKFASKQDPEPEENVVEVDPTPKARQAPAQAHAAPVSRASAPTKSSSSNGKPTLTASEAATAVAIYPNAKTVAEAHARYYMDKQRAIADGKYNRGA